MFPGETGEDLVLILTKNNFDLEKSANDIFGCLDVPKVLYHEYIKTHMTGD